MAPYQRRVLEMALRRDPSGELVFRLVVLSEPKKSGKTFMTACLALWWVQFSRLYENQWVSSESRFIEPSIWDQSVLPSLQPDPTGALFIGIDARVKHDSTALVCVKYDTNSEAGSSVASSCVYVHIGCAVLFNIQNRGGIAIAQNQSCAP